MHFDCRNGSSCYLFLSETGVHFWSRLDGAIMHDVLCMPPAQDPFTECNDRFFHMGFSGEDRRIHVFMLCRSLLVCTFRPTRVLDKCTLEHKLVVTKAVCTFEHVQYL